MEMAKITKLDIIWKPFRIPVQKRNPKLGLFCVGNWVSSNNRFLYICVLKNYFCSCTSLDRQRKVGKNLFYLIISFTIAQYKQFYLLRVSFSFFVHNIIIVMFQYQIIEQNRTGGPIALFVYRDI